MKTVILSLAVLLAGCLAWAIVMTVLWSKEADKSKQAQTPGWYPPLPPDISTLAAGVEDPGLINGEVPPGEIMAATSTLMGLNKENGLYFATWNFQRPPGYRSPVHIHARPVWTCLEEGCVRTFWEGSEPKEHCAPECWWSPSMTKMVSLTIGNVTKEEYDMFVLDESPDGEPIPDWIITEPSALNVIQYEHA